MIHFHCSYHWDEDDRDDWEGTVKRIYKYGNLYELFITSRSNIKVLVGKSDSGMFACIPEYDAGCYLSDLNDKFYNSEKLIYAMENPIDGITVACALKSMAGYLKFE